MSWNVEVKKHYENVSKTYGVLDIISNDEISLKNSLREVIVDEMKLSCECIIDGIGTAKTKTTRKHQHFLKR